MPSSYSFYIDEAGDEGLPWPNSRNPGSPPWFIVSGAVMITANRRSADQIVSDMCSRTGRDTRKNLHWRDLKPEQKEHYARSIGTSNQIRAIVVCVHKPDLDPAVFSAERMYFYFSRFLIERASWFVRDAFSVHEGRIPGDGTFEIIFSKRKTMDYPAFEEYMQRLRTHHSTSMEWRHIGKVSVLGASQSKGLQIADAIGGATFNALNPKRGYPSEPRFLNLIKPILYSHRGRLVSYGLKFFPDSSKTRFESESGYEWLRDYQ